MRSARRAAPGAFRCRRSVRPNARFWRTVSHGNSVGSWNTTIRDGSGFDTSAPFTRIRPADGRSKPAMRFSRADFPHPLGPTRHTNSRGAMPSDTSSRIRTSRGETKVLWTWSTTTLPAALSDRSNASWRGTQAPATSGR
jgi:hypothetical protein